MKKLKFLDLEALQALNENSIRAGRSQHLRPERLLKLKRGRYNLNFQVGHEWGGRPHLPLSLWERDKLTSSQLWHWKWLSRAHHCFPLQLSSVHLWGGSELFR